MIGRTFFWTIVVAMGVPMLAAGCGDDDGPTTVDGGGDAGVTDAGRTDAGRTDGGVDGGSLDDGNDSFADAVAVTVGSMTPTTGALQAPGDHDFFSFTAEADTWIAITTDANPDDDPEMVDTVVTLYDSTMTQVAESDDATPRVNTDSEIIYHVAAAGTFFIEVQEWTTWASDPELEGMPSFTYELSVLELDPASPIVVLDEEPGNDAASAVPLKFSTMATNYGFVGGTFANDTDVDVFSFSVPADTFLSAYMMPAGVDGYGSTAPIGDIWVTDAAGTTIIGRLNNASGDYEDFGPALSAGDYLLWIQHAGTGAGTNDFWFLKAFKLGENPRETMEAENDVAATAEIITQTTDMTTGDRSGFILSELVTDTDVDHYSFEVLADEVVSIGCGSETSGSGVRGLLVQVQDVTGSTTLSMDMESPPDGVFIEDAMITAEGTYLLRLSKTSQDAEVTGTFVRCGVHARVPAP